MQEQKQGFLPGLEAVVVALEADLAVAQFEKHGEAGFHLGAGCERAEGDGEDAAPLHLKGNAIALSEETISWRWLRSTVLPSLLRSTALARSLSRPLGLSRLGSSAFR